MAKSKGQAPAVLESGFEVEVVQRCKINVQFPFYIRGVQKFEHNDEDEDEDEEASGEVRRITHSRFLDDGVEQIICVGSNAQEVVVYVRTDCNMHRPETLKTKISSVFSGMRTSYGKGVSVASVEEWNQACEAAREFFLNLKDYE